MKLYSTIDLHSNNAVESTFNWYWLVDGLMDAGYSLKLVNTVAVKQYDGLKFAATAGRESRRERFDISTQRL